MCGFAPKGYRVKESSEVLENICLCCGKKFENRSSDCCSKTCAECHLNPEMKCPNETN